MIQILQGVTMGTKIDWVHINWDMHKELEEKPGIVYADLDFTQIEKRRSAMPLNKQRRLSETYELLKKDVQKRNYGTVLI